jgi:hypothetical protein
MLRKDDQITKKTGVLARAGQPVRRPRVKAT